MINHGWFHRRQSLFTDFPTDNRTTCLPSDSRFSSELGNTFALFSYFPRGTCIQARQPWTSFASSFLSLSLSLSSLTTLSCSFSLYLSFSLSPSLWFSINNFSIFLHSLISLSTCAVFLSPTLFRLIHWRHGYRPEIPRLGLCVYTCIHVEYSHVYVSSDTLYHLMHLVAYELMIRVNHTHIFVMLLGSTSSMPWDDIKPVCH